MPRVLLNSKRGIFLVSFNDLCEMSPMFGPYNKNIPERVIGTAIFPKCSDFSQYEAILERERPHLNLRRKFPLEFFLCPVSVLPTFRPLGSL